MRQNRTNDTGAAVSYGTGDAGAAVSCKPFVFTNMKTGQGLADVIRFIETEGLTQSKRK